MEDIIIAFSVGLLSAVSWQAVPVMIGLAFLIGGMSLADRPDHDENDLLTAVLPPVVVLYLLGFSAMFLALSLPATSAGGRAWELQDILRQGCGAFTFLLGLHTAGLNPTRFMTSRSDKNQTRQPVPSVAFLLVGLGVAAGWSPKAGLVLTSVMVYAASQGHLYHGMVLLMAYIMGFTLLFFLSGLALTLLLDLIPFGKRAAARGAVVCGLALAALGVLLFFNQLVLVVPVLENGPTW